jgi:hypothetical protein
MISLVGNAQTGIGTTTPDASAKLEVSASNKGFLPPRVTLTSGADTTTIPSPATGLLVYNTGNNVGLVAGYYYWNGANWATIATASSPDQTVDYVSVTRTTVQTVNEGGNILFNQINGGNIPYNTSTGLFTLIAGKTYRLTGCVAISSSNASAEEINVQWKNGDGDLLPNKGEALSTNFGTTGFANGVADVIYTPSVNTTVSLSVTYSSGSVVIWSNFTYANIQQIGSSAIVNPWVLSGNDVYNTTGNVGIGTTTPTAKLNIAGGGVKIASGLGNTATRPSLNTASIGNYEIRGVGGGSPQIDGQDDGFLRLSAGGGSNTNTQSSIDISGYSTVGDMSNTIVMRTGGTERLRIDPSGNVTITGKLNVGDPTGNVSTKLVGRVTAGTFLTFENLKFSVTTSGQRGLSIATVSGTVNLYVEGKYNNGNAYGSRTDTAVSYTTTPSGSPFGWGFLSAGDTIIYHLTDADNSRMYRVTLIIMPSYINNFIAVERLL